MKRNVLWGPTETMLERYLEISLMKSDLQIYSWRNERQKQYTRPKQATINKNLAHINEHKVTMNDPKLKLIDLLRQYAKWVPRELSIDQK